MKLTKKEFEIIAKQYSLGNLKKVENIAGGYVNHSFELITEKGEFIIQVLGYEYTAWKEGKMNLEFDTLIYLKNKDFPYEVPLPIKNKNKLYILKLGDKHLWVYKKIEGKIYNKFNLDQFKKDAQALAVYHKYIKKMPLKNKENDFLHLDWHIKKFDEFKKINPKNKVDFLFLKNMDFFRDLLLSLENRFKTKLILTHGDFNTNNLIFRDNKLVGIIDFDNLGFAPIGQDIAIAVKRARYLGRGFSSEKLKIFLKEYEKHNNLTVKDKELIIPCLLKDNCGLFQWFYYGMKKHPEEKYSAMLQVIKETKKLVESI